MRLACMKKAEERGIHWFETAFGRLYPLVYAHRDDDSASREIECLGRWLNLTGTRLKTLDVCCGTGRHTEALAGMGLDVTGMDLSMVLLTRGAARPGLTGCLVRAEMRALPFGSEFDLVTNLFTSFGYFSDDRDNEQALREMARVLVPDGRLVLDHMNRTAVESKLVHEDSETRDGLRIRQARRIEGNRMKKEIDVEIIADGERIHLVEDVRLYSPAEMRCLLEASGLEEIGLYGDFDGGALRGSSPRMIAVAAKKGI
jgi:SAM-dependent methyltransferase